MRTLTFEEIRKLDSGEIIPSLEAQVGKVFDQKTGTGQYGKWHMQNIVLSQGGDELHATWCGEEPMRKESIGTMFHFESSDTKHGKQGLKWEITKKGENTYQQIRITGVAKIKPVNGASPQPSRAEPPPDNVIEYDEVTAVRNAREFAMKSANALLIALDATLHVANEYEKKHLGEEVPEAQKQAMTSSIFIGMHKEGFVTTLPSHPIKPLVREAVLPEKVELPKPDEPEADW